MRDEKKLKKDAYRLCESAETVYWHELSKPESERDTDLMEECLLVMQSAATETKRSTAGNKFSFKWVAAACAALLLMIAVSTGVAAALGYNLWNVIFSGTNTGFEINGKNDSDEMQTIDFDAIPPVNREQADSISAAEEKLKIKPLNFDLTKHGYMIDNIYITKNDAVIELLITYMKSDAYVDVTVQVYNGGANSAFVSELVGEFNPVMISIAGHDVYKADGTENYDSIICWADGEYIYQFTSNESADVLAGYVAEAYKK